MYHVIGIPEFLTDLITISRIWLQVTRDDHVELA